MYRSTANETAIQFADWVTARRVLSIGQPYLRALLLVVVALALTLGLQQLYVGRPPLFLFFAAISAAAWLGGSGPGYFAVAISAPMGFHFYATSLPSSELKTADVVLFVFFATCAFAGGALNSRRRQTEENLGRAHRQLQIKAAELLAANSTLKAEIAERQRTEDVLEVTRNKLARAARLTSMAELAASIAHEINQPLTAVATNAGACIRWLEAPEPDLKEARDTARRIMRDAERAGQVVGRVRAMVRKSLSERSEISVAACISEVLAVFATDIDKADVLLSTDIADNLPRIQGDRIQLQQVIANLIGNALESLTAVSGRRRELTITAHAEAATGIQIEVRDNGPGLSEGTRDKLFEPFVTTKPGGMGMGLSICKTIVEAHGGTLTAEPVAQGALFCVILPRSPE